ncbi:GNAT family N-acetyltransferase [Brevibacillus sp. HD1.4A]|uniref:GNAT family N-acetyltransferase n=1 Tax=Brevibacillus sp. HD1.4A TaxID=2738978 RepID=UPI00156B6685|nr:GNAT family N-acetyltransferase [Brevibacillus sp. HD1.4A]NRQ51917.1 GNAT family N-acetyltransferase [Brevibacillus sp. HD1.4A]
MKDKRITTERLVLTPFTKSSAESILRGNFDELLVDGYRLGNGWPDEDAIETLPKIIKNLELVGEPTGFESWMIVKKDGNTIIGDAGFKGRPNELGEVDIGYGIIRQERKQGFGVEAAKGLVKWAFSQAEVKAITARCLIHNADSARILEKLNFQETARDGEMIYWSLMRENVEGVSE